MQSNKTCMLTCRIGTRCPFGANFPAKTISWCTTRETRLAGSWRLGTCEFEKFFLDPLMLKMNSRESIKYSFHCGLRGYHIYKEAWTPIVGEVSKCRHERKNPFDRYAIAAMKHLPGRLTYCTVGHLPREISRFFCWEEALSQLKLQTTSTDDHH